MKVIITESASDSLWPIYEYHCQYSENYADDFQHEIDRFILEHLSANPMLGHLYHDGREIRRLIFQKRYNIYYIVRNDAVYVLFIFDGRMGINQDIEERGLDTDSLIK